MLLDLSPGSASSKIRSLCVANGRLFFRLDTQIFVSDGTAAGTRNLQDRTVPPRFVAATDLKIHPTPAGIYFFADDGVHGYEPWFSDGTLYKARLVADVVPGSSSSARAPSITTLGHALILPRLDPNTGVWSILLFDATKNLNYELSNAQTAAVLKSNFQLWSVGQHIWLQPGYSNPNPRPTPWVADASPGSMRPITSSQHGTVYRLGDVFEFGGMTRLFAEDAAGNIQAWQSDGTPAGTRLWFALPPQPVGARSPVVGDKRFYFAHNNNELWVSDGTAAGTRVCTWRGLPIRYSEYYGGPTQHSAMLGDRLVFRFEDYRGVEPWVTDASESGTQCLQNIRAASGVGSGDPRDINQHDGKLYFSADDHVHGRELWVSDGSKAGTRMVADIHPGFGSAKVSRLYSALGRLWFEATDGVTPVQPWVSDGTAKGTRKLGLPGVTLDRGLATVIEFDGLAFCKITGSNQAEIWVSDGSTAPPQLLSQVFPGPSFDAIGTLIGRAGDRLYILPDNSLQMAGFYVLDPGSTSFRLVTQSQNSTAKSIVGDFEGALLYTELLGGQTLLWSTRGSAATTLQLASGRLLSAKILEDEIWIIMEDAQQRPGIYVSDGTPSGLRKIQQLASRSPVYAQFFCKTGGIVYYQLRETWNNSVQLWASDGQSTWSLPSLTLDHLMVSTVPGEVWFSGLNAQSESSLYYSDGSAAGTYEIPKRLNHPALSFTTLGQPIRGRAVFLANTAQHGIELRISKPAAGRTPIGRPCGPHSPRLSSDAPRLGQNMNVAGASAPGGSAGVFLLGGIAAPTLPMGGVDCRLEVDPLTLAILHPFAVTQSSWQLPVPIPQDSGLLGLSFAMQSIYVSPGALEASAGIHGMIGF
jgi:ELWxxDGT repeat protein